MAITNKQSGTNVHEVADGIYRINTPVALPGGGGFSFNQYLILDDEPLIFHTGPRKMFPLVHEAVASVVSPKRLRHVAFSHVESDECGSLNEWLAAAPEAAPLCGNIAALVSIGDLADRPPRALADGESLSLGKHTVRWYDTPHLPHGWECGFLMEEATRTLLCGDLFTQGGDDNPPVTESDILGPSEAFRHQMDYFSHTKNARQMLERLASTGPTTLACMHGSALGPSEAFRHQMDYFSHTKNARQMLERLASTGPTTLACMHGSAWRGDGAKLLRALADAVGA